MSALFSRRNCSVKRCSTNKYAIRTTGNCLHNVSTSSYTTIDVHRDCLIYCFGNIR